MYRQNESGQPWLRMIGSARVAARAWMRWIREPSSRTRNRGSRLSAASWAGQSNSSAQ